MSKTPALVSRPAFFINHPDNPPDTHLRRHPNRKSFPREPQYSSTMPHAPTIPPPSNHRLRFPSRTPAPGKISALPGTAGVQPARLGAYFSAYDGNGNVRALVKADAVNPAASAITARYAYDGFGKEVAVSGADADKNAFRFSTKQLDAETGMNYYGFRFYDANNGRWINRDPIAEEGGLNVYSMVGNDAIDRYDVLGNQQNTSNFIDCMADCIKNNDPIDSFLNQALLTLAGGTYPKSWLASVADTIGEAQLAKSIRMTMSTGATEVTTIPSTLQLALRGSGRTGLRALGRFASPIWIAYGVALVGVEAGCAAGCGSVCKSIW